MELTELLHPQAALVGVPRGERSRRDEDQAHDGGMPDGELLNLAHAQVLTTATISATVAMIKAATDTAAPMETVALALSTVSPAFATASRNPIAHHPCSTTGCIFSHEGSTWEVVTWDAA